jgi:plasmid stabilization system protein ParE
MEPVTSTDTPASTLQDLWRAGYGSTVAWLRDLAHLTTADAKKLLARALALNPTRALDGTPIPARAPLTGTAAVEGALGAAQIDTILAALKGLPDTISDNDRTGAEKILVDLARDAGPSEIRRAGNRLRDLLDPDGSAPKDPPLKPDREVHFREHRDGSATMTAKLDPVTYAETRSVIDPSSKPHPATDEGRDTRSTGERQGDGFAEMVRLAMMSEELPLHGGDRTHIVVTLDYESLRSGIGKACLDVVGEITAAEARILACDCTIIPMVLGSESQPLNVGRTQRFVTPGQRRALHARDHGCAFPGCNRKPRHCDGPPSRRVDRRRANRSLQVDLPLWTAPQATAPQRLGSPHGSRRKTRIHPTRLPRPTTKTPTQHHAQRRSLDRWRKGQRKSSAWSTAHWA